MARKTRTFNTSSLNTRSLKDTGEALADRAVNTWNGVASTIEDAAARAQSVSHDAHGSVRGGAKSVRKARDRAQKNAQKQLNDARKTVKGARRETARRTGAARDALAGRKPRRGWTMFLTAAGIGLGAVLGAAGARMAKRDADRLEAGDPASTQSAATRSDTPRIDALRAGSSRLGGTLVDAARTDADRLEADLADAVTTAKVAVPPSKPIPTAAPTVPQPTAAGSMNGSVKRAGKSADQIG